MCKNKDRIQIGDIVSVYINTGMTLISSKAKVLHLPTATGDSWIFKDITNGDIHYISEGCTVTKKNNDNNDIEDWDACVEEIPKAKKQWEFKAKLNKEENKQ